MSDPTKKRKREIETEMRLLSESGIGDRALGAGLAHLARELRELAELDDAPPHAGAAFSGDLDAHDAAEAAAAAAPPPIQAAQQQPPFQQPPAPPIQAMPPPPPPPLGPPIHGLHGGAAAVALDIGAAAAAAAAPSPRPKMVDTTLTGKLEVSTDPIMTGTWCNDHHRDQPFVLHGISRGGSKIGRWDGVFNLGPQRYRDCIFRLEETDRFENGTAIEGSGAFRIEGGTGQWTEYEFSGEINDDVITMHRRENHNAYATPKLWECAAVGCGRANGIIEDTCARCEKPRPARQREAPDRLGAPTDEENMDQEELWNQRADSEVCHVCGSGDPDEYGDSVMLCFHLDLASAENKCVSVHWRCEKLRKEPVHWYCPGACRDRNAARVAKLAKGGGGGGGGGGGQVSAFRHPLGPPSGENYRNNLANARASNREAGLDEDYGLGR